MATHGARRLTDMGENAANVLAMELLAAAQGIDFHRPMRTSGPLERVMAEVRARATSYDQDRYFAPDIAAVMRTVSAGAYRWTLPSGLEAEQ
jgi:histidine ammonia-lyase